MENAKTPTGDSTGKLTKEQAMLLIEKTVPAKLTAVNGQELDKEIELDIMGVTVEKAANEHSLPGTEPKDSISAIVAGRKSRKGAEIVYENGEFVKPAAQKPNKTLQEAQRRIDIEQSAEEKQATGSTQSRE